jgi:membrane associated rhomboid family serine protease
MDWSLVLVSQGIETTISPPGPDHEWELILSSESFERAIAVLKQYHLENRRWQWQQEVLKPGLLFDWAALAWMFLCILFYALDARSELRSVGRVDSVQLIAGEWWRLFTAQWLHGDLGHLAANLSLGLVLLGLAMGYYGTGVGLLAAYLAGAIGNLAAAFLSRSQHLSLGASGLVMACLGLLAVQSFSHLRSNPRALRLAIGGIIGGAMLFALLGLGPETDVVAHLGGFVAGIIIGIPLNLLPSIARQGKTNLVCGFIFAVLVIVPWWLALRHTASPFHGE